MLKKKQNIIALAIGVVFIILALVFRLVVLDRPSTISLTTSSTLLEAINISELSAAEFKYRGIAPIYADEERKKLLCRVCYNAVVKAGIDMQKVGFDVDEENKTVTASLPPIDIKVTIVDEKSIAVLPSNADVRLDYMLKFSKEDAENEARESDTLMDTARENVQAIIEGLIYPILKPEGFTLKWK